MRLNSPVSQSVFIQCVRWGAKLSSTSSFVIVSLKIVFNGTLDTLYSFVYFASTKVIVYNCYSVVVKNKLYGS